MKVRFSPISSSPEEGEAGFLCRFPQGLPGALSSSSSSSSSPLSFNLSYNSDPKKSHQKIISSNPSSSYVSFEGKNFGSDAKGGRNTYAIAIVPSSSSSSQKEKVIEILPIPTIFSVTATVKEQFKQEEEEEKEEGVLSFAERQSSLVEQFASKKKKSQHRSKIANKVTLQEDISYVLHSALNSSASSTSALGEERVIEEEDETILKTKNLILPQFNLETEKVEDIYPISSLFSAEEGSLLQFKFLLSACATSTDLVAYTEKAQASQNFVPEFFLYRLKELGKIQDPQEAKKKAQLLDYTRLLLQFRALRPANKGRQITSLFPLPDAIKEKLLRDFCTPVQGHNFLEYSTDSQAQRKLTAFICVVSLLLCGFKLGAEDIELLAKDMKMLVSELLQYFKEVGCTSATKFKVQLTAPLTLPRLARRQRKRKQ